MPSLRPAVPSDIDAFYAICLATGDAGADASHLYADGRLIGHIYSAPYLRLAPDLAIIIEDEEGVAGYAVGVSDTRAWEDQLERDWWPSLREEHPDPLGPMSEWTADEQRCGTIHRPWRVPDELVRTYPAHLHLNLLPRMQGRGAGKALLRAWLHRAEKAGVTGVHVGVGPINERAMRFWTHNGFLPADGVEVSARTAWLGLVLRENQSG